MTMTFGTKARGLSCWRETLMVGDLVSHPKKKGIGTVVASGRTSKNMRDVDIYWQGEGLANHIEKQNDAFFKKLTFVFRCAYMVERFAFKQLLFLLEALDTKNPDIIEKMIAAVKIHCGQTQIDTDDLGQYPLDRILGR